jgi:hypothetical protein
LSKLYFQRFESLLTHLSAPLADLGPQGQEDVRMQVHKLLDGLACCSELQTGYAGHVEARLTCRAAGWLGWLEIVLVSVTTFVYDFAPLVKHGPRQVPGY